MTSLTDIAARQQGRRGPVPAMEATIADPPVAASGWLRVTIDHHQGVVHECPWAPRGVPPTAGDAALVVESDAGNLWCVAWWPQ